MLRFLKYLLGIAVCVALGIAALLLALRLIFPPARLRSIALEKLGAALEREVRLDSIGIGLRGVDIRGFRVSEAPNFGSGTFLTVNDLLIRLRLAPLLHKRLEVADVLLSGWTCRVVKNPDGTYNWSTLGSKAGTAPSQAPVAPAKVSARAGAPAATPRDAPQPNFFWTVGRIRFSRGNIAYEDKSSNTSINIEDMDLDAKELRPSGAFPVKLALSYAGKSGKTQLNGRLDYRGTVDLGDMNASKMAVRFDPFKLEYLGVPLEASGSIRDFTSPEADLKVSLPRLDAARLKPLATIPDGMTLPALRSELHFKKSGTAIQIPSISLQAGDLRISGKGTIRAQRGPGAGQPGRSPSFDFDVATNLFQIADFIPPSLDIRPRGNVSLQTHLSGTADAPIVHANAELKQLSLRYAGQDFSAVDGTAKLSPDSVSLIAAGRWNKGDFKMDLAVQDYKRSPDVRMEGTLSELDLSRLPQSSEPGGAKTPTGAGPGAADRALSRGSAASEGRLGAAASASPPSISIKSSGKLAIGKIIHPNFRASNLDVQWSLNSIQPSQLTGPVQFRLGQGSFDNLSSFTGGNALVRIVVTPILILQKAAGLVKIPLFPAFDRVHFKEITGNYAFRNGVMTVKESHMDSDAAYVTTTGTADFRTNQLNLRILTKLGAQVGLKLGGPVGLTVQGSMDNPSVRPDLQSILSQPGVNEAVEQGKKLLQNIFK